MSKLEAGTEGYDYASREEPNCCQNFVLRCCSPCYGRDKIIAESREWEMVFSKCGHRTNIWDMGGTRYGGAGQIQSFGKCPVCKKRSPVMVSRESKKKCAIQEKPEQAQEIQRD